MQDLRMKKPKSLLSLSAKSILINENLSQVEKVKLCVLLDFSQHNEQEVRQSASSIIFDLYHGLHPLCQYLEAGDYCRLSDLLPEYFV